MNRNDDDDVTIEDQSDSFEDFSSKSIEKTNSFYAQLNFQWIWILSFLSLILILFFMTKKKFTKKLPTKKEDDEINEYERMERIREKQQKAYEERVAQQKQLKIEKAKELKEETPKKPLKYRSNDHNPLTGQSTSGKGDSCSWRSSSSRRKPQGG